MNCQQTLASLKHTQSILQSLNVKIIPVMKIFVDPAVDALDLVIRRLTEQPWNVIIGYN